MPHSRVQRLTDTHVQASSNFIACFCRMCFHGNLVYVRHNIIVHYIIYISFLLHIKSWINIHVFYDVTTWSVEFLYTWITSSEINDLNSLLTFVESNLLHKGFMGWTRLFLFTIIILILDQNEAHIIHRPRYTFIEVYIVQAYQKKSVNLHCLQ